MSVTKSTGRAGVTGKAHVDGPSPGSPVAPPGSEVPTGRCPRTPPAGSTSRHPTLLVLRTSPDTGLSFPGSSVPEYRFRTRGRDSPSTPTRLPACH